MKKWWQSKTEWVNILAAVAIIAQVVIGREILPPAFQGAILVLINIVLRIVTTEPIEW